MENIAQWRFLSWWLEGPGPADLLTAPGISAAADRAADFKSAQSQIAEAAAAAAAYSAASSQSAAANSQTATAAAAAATQQPQLL